MSTDTKSANPQIEEPTAMTRSNSAWKRCPISSVGMFPAPKKGSAGLSCARSQRTRSTSPASVHRPEAKETIAHLAERTGHGRAHGSTRKNAPAAAPSAFAKMSVREATR
jgi:hypothetical protein